jgi:hypothetical protein
MSTLPPPVTKHFPENSLEKKVYKIVDNLSEFIPIPNDRNRLGFSLYKYVTGQGDPPSILLKSSKVKVVGISLEELTKKITKELEAVKNKP